MHLDLVLPMVFGYELGLTLVCASLVNFATISGPAQNCGRKCFRLCQLGLAHGLIANEQTSRFFLSASLMDSLATASGTPQNCSENSEPCT